MGLTDNLRRWIRPEAAARPSPALAVRPSPALAVRPSPALAVQPLPAHKPPAPGSIASAVAALARGEEIAPIDAGVSFTSAPVSAAPVEVAVQAAVDGTPFWGQVDTPSARAKAKGETLVIDQEDCIACGTCVENTDIVFVLPDDAKATVVAQDGPMDLVQDAIDACPVMCISWTDDPDSVPRLNDATGRPLAERPVT